ncbi:hypothetical protein HanRHA438_Chr10g0450601 [Helianthus annuus]|nr:hypothetical protein HanIR_Chr10g0472681 [Helianthus annuus]KAJ0879366.1 hypothetical protein HanRHA438_Chr10g0450601 [Helianthus annuus]
MFQNESLNSKNQTKKFTSRVRVRYENNVEDDYGWFQNKSMINIVSDAISHARFIKDFLFLVFKSSQFIITHSPVLFYVKPNFTHFVFYLDP